MGPISPVVSLTVPPGVTQRTIIGVVFIPMHFAEAVADLLTIYALDPLAQDPGIQSLRGERGTLR
jgi:hypothetical protein